MQDLSDHLVGLILHHEEEPSTCRLLLVGIFAANTGESIWLTGSK